MINQWSHLSETYTIDNEMSGPTTTLNYEEAILSASDAECGEWVPMSIQSFNPPHTHYVLGNATVIESIVATQPKGKFDLALANQLRTNDISDAVLPQ
ncbi:hypothetical protein CU097_006403 [Rhizopus azygosporus]|uniref:Uncharacterized protein n=1 Tax=Rhizopus azygosporus TaxID=86630 RepID=A0A367J7C9_RHIAZ|nr:hypothetical protein CU097_006403 [Rhizopus azygosporus]